MKPSTEELLARWNARDELYAENQTQLGPSERAAIRAWRLQELRIQVHPEDQPMVWSHLNVRHPV